jgi:hypothetical protein
MQTGNRLKQSERNEMAEIDDGPPMIIGIAFTVGRPEPVDMDLAFNTLLDRDSDDELIYYGYSGQTAWAFSTPEELGAWAAQHPEGTWDVAVRREL